MTTIGTRLRLALWALTGKLNMTDEDDAEYDEVDELTAVGPTRSVRCAETPTDGVSVRPAVAPNLGPIVALGAVQGGDTAMIALRPSDARRFAAGVLDAADEADGTEPLLFMPPGDVTPPAAE